MTFKFWLKLLNFFGAFIASIYHHLEPDEMTSNDFLKCIFNKINQKIEYVQDEYDQKTIELTLGRPMPKSETKFGLIFWLFLDFQGYFKYFAQSLNAVGVEKKELFWPNQRQMKGEFVYIEMVKYKFTELQCHIWVKFLLFHSKF